MTVEEAFRALFAPTAPLSRVALSKLRRAADELYYGQPGATRRLDTPELLVADRELVRLTHPRVTINAAVRACTAAHVRGRWWRQAGTVSVTIDCHSTESLRALDRARACVAAVIESIGRVDVETRYHGRPVWGSRLKSARYPPCPDAWPSEVVLVVRVATLDVAVLEPLVTALRASLEADGYEVTSASAAGAPARSGDPSHFLSTFCP